MGEAFRVLGVALLSSVPSPPKGLTLREEVEMSKSFGIDADWGRVEAALRIYEGIRYGGEQNPSADFSEVIALAEALEEAALR